MKMEAIKAMKKSVVLICGLFGLLSFSQLIFADEWSPTLPKTITLLHETKLYSSPNESTPSWASLTPQNVQTVSAETDWYRPLPSDKKWVKIQTNWLGEQWIHIDYHEIGWMTPKDEFLDVSGVMTLYNGPEYGSTGATLSSQIVHTKGVFYRPLQNPSWLIDTWLGDKWFTPYQADVIEDVTKATYETVNLQGRASLFRAPSNQPYSLNTPTIEPQTLRAIALHGDFYKVKTSDGKLGWVSTRYSQPTVMEEISIDIPLTEKTSLYEYPNLQSFLDPLAPQTVHAKGKVQDVWGNTWFHISTWMGDAWLLHNDNEDLNPNKISDNNGYIHVFPQTVSGNKAVSGRLYVVNMPKYEGYGGFSFTLQMIDDKGNLLASASTSVSGVQQNDDIPFNAVLDRMEPSFHNYTFRLVNVQFKSAY